MTVATAPASWLLPPDAYWDRTWYEREQEAVFRRCWTFIGMVEDFAGGSQVVDVAGTPVVIALEGAALTASAGCVADWNGMVFAHLDPDAPPLRQWLGELPDRIGAFRPDRLVEVARHRFTIDANWKFFVENHVDVYHLWYLHRETLGAYDHHRASWSTPGPHWVFYEPPRPDVDVDAASFWRGLRPIGHVGRDRWGSGAHLIFPNLTFATGAGFFMTYQCVPTGPSTSIVDMRVRAEEGSDASSMLALSRAVIEQEDGAACEAMQRAVRSPWFRVGPLARSHELPITRFQRVVLDHLGLDHPAADRP